jgi:hypothetical protein
MREVADIAGLMWFALMAAAGTGCPRLKSPRPQRQDPPVLNLSKFPVKLPDNPIARGFANVNGS